jgi:hypothetical protein
VQLQSSGLPNGTGGTHIRNLWCPTTHKALPFSTPLKENSMKLLKLCAALGLLAATAMAYAAVAN